MSPRLDAWSAHHRSLRGIRALCRLLPGRNGLLLLASVLLLSGCSLALLAPLQGIAAIVVALLVGLSACTGGSSGDGATPDTPAAPGLSVDDVTVGEADGTATFTVTRSGDTTDTASVDYATGGADDTATADTDYTTASGTLTFATGETSQTFDVTIVDDSEVEGDETFTVTLSNATGADLSDATGVGTITDNDGTAGGGTPTPPSLSIADVTASEADGTATFTVTKTGSTDAQATVDYATADDSAKAGSDYTAASGTLTFAAADTSKTITVPITDDTAFEGAEVFTVTLSNPTAATIAADKAIGTIQSDDESGPLDVAALGEAGITLSGAANNGNLGSSLASVGDVDDDGLADALVGAPFANIPSSGPMDQGKGYLIFGDTALASQNVSSVAVPGGYQLLGPSTMDGKQIGAGAAAAGDVNRDGFADLLIGGADFNAVGKDAVVVFGKGGGFANVDLGSLGSSGVAYAQQASRDHMGPALSTVGDFDGDGVDDFVIGASQANNNAGSGTSPGRAYVIFGKVGLTSVTISDSLSGSGGVAIQGQANERLGGAVGGGGDFNGDGYADLIVGAPQHSTACETTAGRAFVILGDPTRPPDFSVSSVDGSTVAGFQMTGAASGDTAGSAVANAGDVNGDGYDDVLIGAPNATGSTSAEGKAYLIFGQASTPADFALSNGLGTSGVVFAGATSQELVGQSVAGAGDVNGDGYDDFLIGTNESACGPTQTSVYLVFGKASYGVSPVILPSNLTGTVGIRITGTIAQNVMPTTVGPGGDLNGDGFADLIIGGPGSEADAVSVPNSNEGKAFIIYGGDFRGDVTHLGTSGDDTLVGTSGADIMVGGRGNDVLDGRGGADAMAGGAGDDGFIVPDLNFRRVDGGLGHDGLQITGSGLTLDLSLAGAGAGTRIRNIEGIDITGSGNNTLTLTPEAVSMLSAGLVRSESNTFHLAVTGNTGDVVNLMGSWVLNSGAQEVIDGVTFNRYDTNGNNGVSVMIQTDITVNINAPIPGPA